MIWFVFRSSLALAGPATHIRHFPSPRSSTSRILRPSSKMVSLPTTPMSAAPYSTQVGTSEVLERKNFNFNSSLTKISLRVSLSFISSQVMPVCSSNCNVCFAKRPFASAIVIYFIWFPSNWYFRIQIVYIFRLPHKESGKSDCGLHSLHRAPSAWLHFSAW